MEKNFMAVIDKKYQRYPSESEPPVVLFSWIKREMEELGKAIYSLNENKINRLFNIREEIADVSNCLDFLYESILIREIESLRNE